MPRHVRLTAWDATFGGSDDNEQSIGTVKLLKSNDNTSVTRGSKREREGNDTKETKKSKFENKAGYTHRYKPNPDDLEEKADLIIFGEDRSQDDDPNTKPVRILSDFCIFDPNHGMEIVSLELLQESDGVADRHFEAAGWVFPDFLNPEDEGQEDDIDDKRDFNFQRVRTSAIMNFSFDYTIPDDPLYIQTEFAYYKLTSATKIYQDCFSNFLRPKRIAQQVISSAVENPELTFREFCLNFQNVNASESFTESDITSAIPTISAALKGVDNGAQIASTVLLKAILDGQKPLSFTRRALQNQHDSLVRQRMLPRQSRWATADIDVLVLRPENQTPTSVTPFIARLAYGLFRERFVVLGPRPKMLDANTYTDVARKKDRNMLWYTISEGHRLEKATQHTRNVVFRMSDRIRDEFFKCVTVDGIQYKVGDVVLVRAGKYGGRKLEPLPLKRDEVPEHASLARYFWFAKILYIDQMRKRFHVRWYEHSSFTMLQALGDHRELFLWNGCDDIDIRHALRNITVHHQCTDRSMVPPSEYFCNLVYDPSDASFTDLEESEFAIAAKASHPPENCPVCLFRTQKQQDQGGRVIPRGIVWRNTPYHVGDFALIRADDGPGEIVQVEDIAAQGSRDVRKFVAQLTVRLLGRMSDHMQICPGTVLKDERHLFLTDMRREISVDRIEHRCFVQVAHVGTRENLRAWLDSSPYHFYAHYKFVDNQPGSWAKKTILSPKKALMCKQCTDENEKILGEENDFLNATQRRPMKGLDLFAGAGAFGLAMEATGCIKITHAIEISPSAARTLKINSPDTIVYNQCANVVLRYAIKSQELQGQKFEIPQNILGTEQLAPPPKPGEIDVLIAGFPCQPHSTLNMFQKANDRKTHLIATLMAYIDHYKPKYVFLENVRGFLSHALQAVQANRHKVVGGVEKGGLKWLVATFLELGFQVRFGLLQAAHYGTPQSRVRFFLIASRRGLPLPQFPTPTHFFHVKDNLEIKLTDDEPAAAVRTAAGVAPFSFVSIEDAIGDLPRFDWENPKKLEARQGGRSRSASMRASEEPAPERQVREVACRSDKPFCGFAGSNVEYFSEPRTTFQVKSREKPTMDLQHYTRVLKPETVERVINIPLRAKADYRSLPVYLHEWQFADPSSALARNGFPPGLYGRLAPNECFHTTVTNVEPTAKQSWVLHPWCKRVITVRELARSQGFPDHFVFYARDSDVKTMQRQIGNAVPWPLAAALGQELRAALFKKWKKEKEEAILVE
ncbi:hypothetical protein CERSUDRAFT_99217 [Gelatoporia subvermispora B]|uniref:DNA (cytosine-5-)-methyltransferase n=1 Tax=Ceriporiopsis subvermispora (strain B) TaxID=914234 RepID=M2R3P8_CERS8|nr:hypothetical protein CERSUDRAFT_99217 [Gelatoporia subvermispora B]